MSEISLEEAAAQLALSPTTIVNWIVDLDYTLRWKDGHWLIGEQTFAALKEHFTAWESGASEVVAG